MRIIIKILLSIVLFFLSLIISLFIKVMFSPNDMFSMPAGIVFYVTLFGGLIGIWRYKPKKNKTENSENKHNLDKSL